ncbi:MAG TPA: hypothetical protein VFA30_04630 [Gaiellaceae bacterium]|nr:hypothetical protein [Gaiellaceae bacterium]
MRILLALTAVLAAGTPNVSKLILAPTQVGTGYVELQRQDGKGVVNTVTLDLCGTAGYPSEKLRTSRLQVNYLKQGGTLGLSNEVVTYRPGGAAQAIREALHHAKTCPNRPIATGEPGVPPLLYTITRFHDSHLLKGYLAVKIRVRGTIKVKVTKKVKGKSTTTVQAHKVDTTSYAIYQRLGNVLSGTYSYGPNTPAQLHFALHAAEQSAENLRRGHNAASPVA